MIFRPKGVYSVEFVDRGAFSGVLSHDFSGNLLSLFGLCDLFSFAAIEIPHIFLIYFEKVRRIIIK
jgi:hypothetical protein